jgi:hypothetical protein
MVFKLLLNLRVTYLTVASDAQRPCGTCKRSHRNALAHAEPGQVIPPQPDCSYDDLAPSTVSSESGPKTRFERLEGRMRMS